MPRPRPADRSDKLSRVVSYVAMAMDEATASVEEQTRLIEQDVADHAPCTIVASVVEELHKPWVPPMLRGGLRRALRAVVAHRADVFIVAHRDRLGKELLDRVLVCQIVEDLGAHVVAVSGGLSGSRSERALHLEARQALGWYRKWIEERHREEAHTCLRRCQGWPPDESISTPDRDPDSPADEVE